MVTTSVDCSDEPSTGACEVCRGVRFETIATRDRRGERLDTVICTRCGLVRVKDVPGESELSEYYATKYRLDYHGEQTPCAYRVVRAWATGRRRFRRLRPFLSPGARVFEIGAGLGCTLKYFELDGFDASGIEPGESFHRFSREELFVKVKRAILKEVPAEPTYELILLAHVIEHLRSPRESLSHLRAMLNPGGLVYIECPNCSGNFAQRHKMFHRAHLFNFTPSTLTMLAEHCGLSVYRNFGGDRNPTIAMLFQRSEDFKERIDPDNYRRTLKTMNRYNVVTYHLRPTYLLLRVRKIWDHVAQRLFRDRRLRQILSICRQQTAGRKD